ncbi:hypothetical protein FO519_000671 [Halicephalobus sp. NKZ332]|nr:hypothetical protein FO519_000671 [Halicephalobus sp. NKZ332]
MIYLYFFVLLLSTTVQGQEQLEIVDNEGVVQKCEASEDCEQCVVSESVECPEFMQYSECLVKCSKICQNLNNTDECQEPETCIEGCECIENYFWDKDKGICISKEECEQMINKEIEEVEMIKANCPQFATYDPCPSPCGPVTCENMPFSCNKTGCAPKRCSCRAGFVQLSEDISEGCIPEDECLPAFITTEEPIEGSGEEFGDQVELPKSRDGRSEGCPLHSHIQDCVPSQPVNCYTLDISITFDCGRKRCECDEGYVRADSGDEAACILVQDCPKVTVT